MDIRDTNRGRQIAVEKQYIKGVNLIDVDTTIAEYMSSVVIPILEENGSVVKVPLIYGNAERWAGARKDGYLRDQRGRIQIPLVMFKRNSIARNESLQHFREELSIAAYQKYSKTNRYERFSLQNGAAKPTFETYNIVVPSYVNITYEVMVWTSFTEHMNKIIEAFEHAKDKYWGTEDKFKFKVRIDSFDNQQEVGQGAERIVRTTFSIIVFAHLLSEKYNEKPLTKKSFTPKRVVFGVETDLTGNLFTTPTVYDEYAKVIDFVAVRGSQMANFVNESTVKLTNVKLPVLPTELVGVFDIQNWFRVYINGDFISPSFYSYSYNGTTKEIYFNFVGLSFNIEAEDEVAVTGKFVEL
jgi:hypothetical protein